MTLVAAAVGVECVGINREESTHGAFNRIAGVVGHSDCRRRDLPIAGNFLPSDPSAGFGEVCSAVENNLAGLRLAHADPIFNLVYQFILVGHIARSLRNEFVRRSITDVEPEPGKGLGLAVGLLNTVTVIPILGVAAAIGALICWTMYWVKIADYSSRIALPLSPPTAPTALGD